MSHLQKHTTSVSTWSAFRIFSTCTIIFDHQQSKILSLAPSKPGWIEGTMRKTLTPGASSLLPRDLTIWLWPSALSDVLIDRVPIFETSSSRRHLRFTTMFHQDTFTLCCDAPSIPTPRIRPESPLPVTAFVSCLLSKWSKDSPWTSILVVTVPPGRLKSCDPRPIGDLIEEQESSDLLTKTDANCPLL
jgi:hypothetical protein